MNIMSVGMTLFMRSYYRMILAMYSWVLRESINEFTSQEYLKMKQEVEGFRTRYQHWA